MRHAGINGQTTECRMFMWSDSETTSGHSEFAASLKQALGSIYTRAKNGHLVSGKKFQ